MYRQTIVSVMLALATLVACADPLAEPTAAKVSGVGEGCVKSSDCAGDLKCIGSVCTSSLPAGDVVQATDADAGFADTTEDNAATTPIDTAGDAFVSNDAVACQPTCKPGDCIDSCGGSTCTGPCSDQSACTAGDACVKGACVGGPVVCDDKNPCTDDSCDAAAGCTNVPNAMPCSDDNPCTVGDACKGAACKPGSTKDCPSGDSCVIGKCSPVEGVCKFSNAPDTTSCDDGSACTTGDACLAGTCGGKQKDCNDNNPCTAEQCGQGGSCEVQFLKSSCEDGNSCTIGDLCQDGVCKSGPAKGCSDDSPCTKDSCNVKTGTCVNDAAPFESTTCDADGSACTQGDVCKGGACLPGTKANCSDGSDCTLDVCDAASGCKSTAVAGACNVDDNACTADQCMNGTCKASSPKVCDDQNSCTIDKCDVKSAICLFSALADGAGCDVDGSKCTDSDACTAGTCVAGKQLACDDGNVCTDDACIPKFGCVHYGNNLPCDADSDLCTSNDACKGNVCQAGTKVACSDNNPCTDDMCVPKTGACTYGNNTLPCNDGTACTKDDLCVGGACKGVEAPCDPCNAYGGTALTVTESHIKICKAKILADEALAAAVPKPWRMCSKADMLKYAPSKSLSQVGYCGASAQEILWATNSACPSGLVAFGFITWGGGCGDLPLNSSGSYDCWPKNSGPLAFFVCRD